jgi:hypothetical protein
VEKVTRFENTRSGHVEPLGVRLVLSLVFSLPQRPSRHGDPKAKWEMANNNQKGVSQPQPLPGSQAAQRRAKSDWREYALFPRFAMTRPHRSACPNPREPSVASRRYELRVRRLVMPWPPNHPATCHPATCQPAGTKRSPAPPLPCPSTFRHPGHAIIRKKFCCGEGPLTRCVPPSCGA